MEFWKVQNWIWKNWRTNFGKLEKLNFEKFKNKFSKIRNQILNWKKLELQKIKNLILKNWKTNV